jgi:hypothetical protein
MIRSEFAEGMSGRGTHLWEQDFLGDRPDCCPVREQGGLCVPGGGELFGRTFEAEAADVGANGGIDLSENATSHRKRFGEIFSHSRLL